MSIKYVHDGESYFVGKFDFDGYDINFKKDVREIDDDCYTTGKGDIAFNFVGFVTNSNDDILVSFPKKFHVQNVDNDIKIVFDSIKKHMQKNPDIYIGDKADNIFESNYPFSSFF